jgi:N-acetylneuraminate synthase/N,N'-diacetyllegionaminate synthase
MKTIIIAEAGVNHNGDIELAKKLIDVAVEAGVDYVKFQTFKAENLVSATAQKAAYQIENTKSDHSQLDMLKSLELSHHDHQLLIDYCAQKNIHFFSTAFDLESLDYLASIGLILFKIPSGEITNLPYLRKVSQLAKEVILSTGMSEMDEILEAINVLKKGGIASDKITILHCNTQYPTPMEDVNLLAMLQIKQVFGVNVGYSDHTLGIEVPIAAVALGATMIEKHFTLDRKMDGPDHKASLEPNELIQMVQSIRNIELALGNGQKQVSNSESFNKAIARKSIHLKVSKQLGDEIREADLEMLRPGDGISPMQMDKVIGKKCVKNLEQGHKLSFDDIM